MDRTRARAAAGVPFWRDSVGLAVVAGAVLLWGLEVPSRIFFDETYYVGDARGYLDILVEPSFAVHPPLGKWLIAAGIAVLGDTPVGWRVPGALAGLAMVVVLHRLALRLLGDAPWGRPLAAVAPLLLLLDGVFLVQARTAMLDIFLALFVLVGIWLVVLDRDRAGLLGDRWPAPGGHGLRLLAGVSFGLALGVKWSGLLGLGVAGLLVLTWELGLRRRATGRWWTGLGRLVLSVGTGLVVVPLLVYAATWIPWGAGFEATSTAQCDDNGAGCTFPDRCDSDPATDDCDFSVTERALGVLDHQGEMWRFHSELEADHPYRSSPVTWPVLQRPVVYYYETCSQERADGVLVTDDETGEVSEPEPCVVEQGDAGEIILVGNPVTWWGFLLVTPLLVAGAALRDRRSIVPLLGWAGQFLPWLAISRVAFLFYMVPAVAFQALALPVAATLLRRRGAVLWPYLTAVVGGCVGFAIGQGASLVLDVETITPTGLAIGAGWLLGALVGTGIGQRSEAARQQVLHDQGPAPATEPPRDVPPSTLSPFRQRRLVPTAALTTVALALGLAVYFQPVWRGVPLDTDVVRARWWFDSWV